MVIFNLEQHKVSIVTTCATGPHYVLMICKGISIAVTNSRSVKLGAHCDYLRHWTTLHPSDW